MTGYKVIRSIGKGLFTPFITKKKRSNKVEIQVLTFTGLGVCILNIIINMIIAVRNEKPKSVTNAVIPISFMHQYRNQGAQFLVIARPRGGNPNTTSPTKRDRRMPIDCAFARTTGK